MAGNCLNCGRVVYQKYCPHCGQSTDVSRITWKSFGYDFFRAITHAERSIIGTTWQLIRRPGVMFDEYISGKRKKYQSAATYFLVWVTVSILTHRLVLAQQGFHPVFMKGITFDNAESVRAFIVHGQWFYILTFPISAGLFWFILARPRYSYLESLIITIYAFSTTYMLFVVCYIIGGIVFSLNVLHWAFYTFQVMLTLAYTVWACVNLFRKKKIRFLYARIMIYLLLNMVLVLQLLEFLSNCWVSMEHGVNS